MAVDFDKKKNQKPNTETNKSNNNNNLYAPFYLFLPGGCLSVIRLIFCVCPMFFLFYNLLYFFCFVTQRRIRLSFKVPYSTVYSTLVYYAWGDTRYYRLILLVLVIPYFRKSVAARYPTKTYTIHPRNNSLKLNSHSKKKKKTIIYNFYLWFNLFTDILLQSTAKYIP